jgi:hypothetical protein
MIGTVVTGLAAVQQPAAEKPKLIEVEKLKDNLFVLRGGGGNSAVFVTETGVVVVDSKNPGWGQPLLDKIKDLTPKPVTHLINTHTHYDHVSGNVEFPAAVEVVVHEKTAALMKEMRPVTGAKPRLATSSRTTMAAACRRGPLAIAGQSAAAAIRWNCATSVAATPKATLGWCSRRCASCTPATSSRARTCRCSTPTTAAAASRSARRWRRRRPGSRRMSTPSSPGTAGR